eukprot:gene14466-biopygen4902
MSPEYQNGETGMYANRRPTGALLSHHGDAKPKGMGNGNWAGYGKRNGMGELWNSLEVLPGCSARISERLLYQSECSNLTNGRPRVTLGSGPPGIPFDESLYGDPRELRKSARWPAGARHPFRSRSLTLLLPLPLPLLLPLPCRYFCRYFYRYFLPVRSSCAAKLPRLPGGGVRRDGRQDEAGGRSLLEERPGLARDSAGPEPPSIVSSAPLMSGRNRVRRGCPRTREHVALREAGGPPPSAPSRRLSPRTAGLASFTDFAAAFPHIVDDGALRFAI